MAARAFSALDGGGFAAYFRRLCDPFSTNYLFSLKEILNSSGVKIDIQVQILRWRWKQSIWFYRF